MCASVAPARAQSRNDATSPRNVPEHGESEPLLDRYDWQAWTTQDGLPQNSISAIVQTRDGYLWLATFGGLARFDGVRFRIFDLSNTEALISNRILSLLEDSAGDLWIGTQDGGVVRLRDGVFENFHGRENAPSGPIWTMVEDREGVIWFGSTNLVRYAGGSFDLAGPGGLTTRVKQIWSLHVDREQNLWVATGSGLGRLRDGEWRVFGVADGLPRSNVRFVSEDSRGLLWVGTVGRLYYLDGDRFVEALVQGKPPGWVFAATVDAGGNYWVGSDEGLFLPRAVRGTDGDSNERTLWHRVIGRPVAGGVRSLLEDREGNIWVGTDGDGLLRVRAAPFKPIMPPAGVSGSSDAKSLAGDKRGGLWIHFSGDELGRLEDDKWNALPVDDDLRSISDITSSSDGTLWIIHHNGRRVSNYRDGQFTHLEQAFDSIDSVLVDRQGTVWISSAGALSAVRDGRTETITVADGLPTIGARGVLADSRDGTIWIGADGALTHYRNGEFDQYSSADGLPRGRIRSIHESSDGNLWIATYGGGMARLRDGKFTRYTVLEGLPDNSLGKILEDDAGNLWINSNRGVFRVSLDELNGFADGSLPRINCRTFQTGEARGRSGARTADGRLWFPTIDGVITIGPEIVVPNAVPPPIIIEAVRSSGRSFDLTDQIELPLDRRDVVIEYTGLSFVDPDNVTFRYRLVGYDEDWVTAGTERVAHYTHLPPGSYEFQVQARNTDRVWSEDAATLGIAAPWHFYETAWFFALCGLGVIATGFIGHRVWTRNMRTRNAALRQSEQRYRRVVEDQSEFIVRWLRDGTRTFVNGAYCRHFGLTQDEAIGTNFFPLIAEEDRERIRRKIDSLTPENPVATAEHRVLLPDGTTGWQQWTDGAIFNAAGELIELQSVGRDLSERKRAEMAIQEKEKQLDNLLSNVGVIVLEGDPFDIYYVGGQVERILGYRRELWFEDPDGPVGFWSKHLHPDDLEMLDVCRDAIERGNDHAFEYRMIAADGREVWFYDTVTVETEKGKPVRTRSVMVDITESKRIEEALRRSEERLELAVRGTSDGLWDAELDTGKEYWSPRFKELLGYAEDEIEATHDQFLALLHPEDKAPVSEAIRLHLEENQAYDHEFRLQTKSGEYRWFQSRGEALRDRNGKPYRMAGSIRDITERKRAEQERRRLNQQLRTSIDQMPIAYILWDSQFRVVEWNASAERIFGYSKSEMAGKYAVDYIVPEAVRPLVHEVIKKLMSGEIAEYSSDGNNVRKDGTVISCRWFNTPLKDESGTTLAILSMVIDVTDRKRAEVERQDLEAQLRQSQKMEAIGRLAGGVAHDFNNILTAILGNVELSIDRVRGELGADHDSVRSMEQIEKAAKRASALTRQLLTFSRRDVMQPKVLDLNHILADLDKMLRRLITENIVLETVTDPPLQSVRADAGQLEQVIVNLVVNAAAAMPDGGKLTLETRNVILDENYASVHVEARPGPHVMLAVSDTGHGMDADTRERIFEPFFTTKPVDKGTGLGLATVHGIVKQSRGHITVYSELGHGTTFKVYLPAIEETPAPQTPVSQPEESPQGRETVLLCEDDRPVRELITLTLRTAGYTVVAAGSGQEGIEAAQAHVGPIDLLITDVIMPGMNGRTLAERLRDMFPELPIIFISGYASDVIAHHGVLDEGVEFVEKPFTRRILLTKIRAVLGKTRSDA